MKKEAIKYKGTQIILDGGIGEEKLYGLCEPTSKHRLEKGIEEIRKGILANCEKHKKSADTMSKAAKNHKLNWNSLLKIPSKKHR